MGVKASKTILDGTKLLKTLGIAAPEDLVIKANKSSGFSILVHTSTGLEEPANVKFVSLALLSNGHAEEGTKKVLAGHLKTVLGALEDKIAEKPNAGATYTAEFKPKPWAKNQKPPKTTTTSGSVGNADLCDADEIGQEVNSTSKGSVYLTVALGPQVNVAVRVSTNWSKISIRMEPSNSVDLPDDIQVLAGPAGWTIQKGGKYASQHVNPKGSPALGVKFIGAMLASCGAKFSEIMDSEMYNLAGKGA